jgi:hypothetical protein
MKEQVKASDHFKDSGPMSTQARKLVLSNLKFNGKYLNENIEKAVQEWKKSQSDLSGYNKERLLEEISTEGIIDNKKLALLVSKEVKRRELPESVAAIFNQYGEVDFERFEQSVSPQLVETLIYSLLRKRIVRPNFPGEHYIQVSSSIYDAPVKSSIKKEGVDFVFEQTPELKEIGTPEQYSAYLDTIFTNSKIKDIVYHGTRNTFDKFEKKNKEQYSIENETQTNSLLDGIFFTDKNTALDNYTDENKILKSVIINIQNPLVSDDRRQVSNKNIKSQDGVITTEFIGDSISDVYVVFEPEQIHILGSEQDLKEFKNFVSRKRP